MPAKKTKRATTKKKPKKPVKKTARVSRVKKSASPKKKTTNKKKAVSKKRTTRTKKPARKLAQVAPGVEPIKPAGKPRVAALSFADELHARQSQPRTRSTQANASKSERPARSFSFQLALQQVRNSLPDEPQRPAPEPPLPGPDHVILEATGEKFLSPYVLDLKRGVTVTEAAHLFTKRHKKEPKQEVLNIFEVPNQTIVARFVSACTTLIRPLRRNKQINFAPLPHQFAPGSSLRRTYRSLSWKFRRAVPFSPVARWRERKLQSAFRLPDSYGRQILPVVETTRAGAPIAVRRLSTKLAFLRQRKSDQARRVLVPMKAVLRKPRFSADMLFSHLTLSKAVVPFVALSILVSLPFMASSLFASLKQTQGEVLGATNFAVQRLQQGGEQAKSLDFASAGQQFDDAAKGFQAAGAVLENHYGPAANLLAFLPVIGKKLRSAQNLLNAGSSLSNAADTLSQGFSVFTDPNHFLANEPPTHKLEYLFVRLKEAEPLLKQANATLAKVDLNQLPEDDRAQVQVLQQSLPGVLTQLQQFNTLSDALLAFLGQDTLQRQLILFQNNTELRATGGFMGSIALVDLDRGQINKIQIPGGGPYDYQGSLFENIQAPRALQLINPRLELQDANWFFDWPTSAQKVSSLYEKAGGPSVDGVVAINTNVLAALLDFVGPVDLPSYGQQFTADNFRQVLQNQVEFGYDKTENQPKKIIADLTPIILDKIKNLQPDQYIKLAGVFGDLLAQRDILIYHSDPDIQKSFANFGWTGQVAQTDGDYVAVVHTNLAGGKTDGVIKDSYDMSVHVSESGKITHTLTIERAHTGVKGEALTGVRNVDYLRVYVPEGSHLISSSGFEAPPADLFESPSPDWQQDPDLQASQGSFTTDASGTETYDETGKTVFANWVQVDPGQTARVTLTYESPSDLAAVQVPTREASWLDWFTGEKVQNKTVHPYHLYWQKQSGAWDPQITVTVSYPQQWQVQASSSIVADNENGVWKSTGVMKGDIAYPFLFY